MSTTWYKIDNWARGNESPIFTIRVHKETPKMLVLEEYRLGKRIKIAKKSRWDNHFSTFNEAVEYLRTKYKNQQLTNKESLEKSTDRRNKFEKWASTATDPADQEQSH